MDKKTLKEKAKDFVGKCNVVPLVTAKEGGVIYLTDLLVDFVEFVEKEDK